MTINLELRGSDESDFILRYDSTKGKSYLFIIKDFYLSILRLRPVEKIRTRLHKLLNGQIQYPILNFKLIEHILIKGSASYELENLFSCESHLPLHFFVCFQKEATLSSDMVKPETNPYRFTTCDLKEFSFRHGDHRLPSSLFSSSGIIIHIIVYFHYFISFHFISFHYFI